MRWVNADTRWCCRVTGCLGTSLRATPEVGAVPFARMRLPPGPPRRARPRGGRLPASGLRRTAMRRAAGTGRPSTRRGRTSSSGPSRSRRPGGPRRPPTRSATTGSTRGGSAGRRVIVEHYTAGTTFASAYATFAADVPDSELHELPGHLRALRDRHRRHHLPARPRSTRSAATPWASTTPRSASSTSGRATPRSSGTPPSSTHPYGSPPGSSGATGSSSERDRAQREPHEPVPPRALRSRGGARRTATGRPPT